MENNTTKKRSRFKTELLVFLISLITATGMVLYSVFGYNQGMSEFVQQLHIILLGALAIYFLTLGFRVVFWIIYRIIR